MPKLNIYVDDELAKRVRELRLPMSEISREALWAAVEKEEGAVCRKCGKSASYRIRTEKGTAYSCSNHVAEHIDDFATVTPI